MTLGSDPTPARDVAGGGGLGELAQLARSLEALSEPDGDVARRAQRVAERAERARYHIAVLGDFKRGKSTLVNALVREAVLPSGVIPLTAVATEVHIGSTETVVVSRDGSRQVIEERTVSDYVTETSNPSNAKGVTRVEVGVTTDFGIPGLVLVDTPGLSSVNESNTEEAERALLDSDGAIVVLAADNPLSRTELEVIELLTSRGARVFIVINRCDTLSPAELEEVRAFVSGRIPPVDGGRVFCVSARRELELLGGKTTDSIEFGELRETLNRFVLDELEDARRQSALAALSRLGQELERGLALEESAATLDRAKLDAQISHFSGAIDEGRRLLADDVVLLGHDVDSLVEECARYLSLRAASAALDCLPELNASLIDLPRAHLDQEAREAIEALVRAHFEPIRLAATERVEAHWAALAGRFTDRVQGRVDAVVGAASGLFDVHLPGVELPTLGAQRERFSYHFVYVEGQNAVIGHLLARLVPPAIARRRAERRAALRLRQEFDKHAGRVRYDLAQRIRDAKAELATEMAREFERTQASLLGACREAQARRELGSTAETARSEFRGRLRSLLRQIEEVTRTP